MPILLDNKAEQIVIGNKLIESIHKGDNFVYGQDFLSSYSPSEQGIVIKRATNLAMATKTKITIPEKICGKPVKSVQVWTNNDAGEQIEDIYFPGNASLDLSYRKKGKERRFHIYTFENFDFRNLLEIVGIVSEGFRDKLYINETLAFNPSGTQEDLELFFKSFPNLEAIGDYILNSLDKYWNEIHIPNNIKELKCQHRFSTTNKYYCKLGTELLIPQYNQDVIDLYTEQGEVGSGVAKGIVTCYGWKESSISDDNGGLVKVNYVLDGSNAIIVNIEGNSDNTLTIPNTIDGYKVDGISMEKHWNIGNLVIPENIKVNLDSPGTPCCKAAKYPSESVALESYNSLIKLKTNESEYKNLGLSYRNLTHKKMDLFPVAINNGHTLLTRLYSKNLSSTIEFSNGMKIETTYDPNTSVVGANTVEDIINRINEYIKYNKNSICPMNIIDVLYANNGGYKFYVPYLEKPLIIYSPPDSRYYISIRRPSIPDGEEKKYREVRIVDSDGVGLTIDKGGYSNPVCTYEDDYAKIASLSPEEKSKYWHYEAGIPTPWGDV